MNAHNHAFTEPRLPVDLWAAIAEGEAARKRLDRAARITDRLLPKERPPHGWDDPQGFVNACKHEAARRDLFRHVHLCLKIKDRALKAAREAV